MISPSIFLSGCSPRTLPYSWQKECGAKSYQECTCSVHHPEAAGEAGQPHPGTEPCSQTRSLGRNPSLVLDSSPRDTWPRPHGGCGLLGGGGRGRHRAMFPSTIGILGQNVCSFSDASTCTKVSCGVLGETGCHDGCKKRPEEQKSGQGRGMGFQEHYMLPTVKGS